MVEFTVPTLQVRITVWVPWTRSLPTQHQRCERDSEHHRDVRRTVTGVIQQLGVRHRGADEAREARHSGVHAWSILLSTSQSETHDARLDPCTVPDGADEGSPRVPLRERRHLNTHTKSWVIMDTLTIRGWCVKVSPCLEQCESSCLFRVCFNANKKLAKFDKRLHERDFTTII